MSERPVKAAVLVIGDEVLSGRTQDVNVRQIAEFLSPLGITLGEARVVSDVQDDIVEALNALRTRWDYVFTTGGIGPTHDDITADAVAAAFGCPIDVRADALEILNTWYANSGTELTPARLRMARIPDGAELIANPVTGAPGFQIENVFVLAGVPKICRGMLEDIAHRLQGGAVTQSVSIRLEGVREGDIAEMLGQAALSFPAVSIGSYPWFEELAGGGLSRGVAVVLRSSDAAALARAEQTLRSQLPAQP
ncbi:competence/damage-inducible protein A [Glycocaulis sp.]|uniref:competence/damage-inducible protein A n=1 Tax=Glycocaulis sp. TaxID=1969725 RepID=UPI003D20B45F